MIDLKSRIDRCDWKVISKDLNKKIKNESIKFGGNKILKIYTKLECKTGRRMKVDNRVFFKSESEAIKQGYRLCRNCMRKKYGK